jgi:tRNA A37 methylthiotransferase MiaB
MKIFIETKAHCMQRRLDCKRLINYFKKNSCQIVKKPSLADIFILMTCGAATKFKKKAYNRIDSLLRHKKRIIVLGCLPVIDGNIFKEKFKGQFLSTKNIYKIDNFFPEFNIKYSF